MQQPATATPQTAHPTAQPVPQFPMANPLAPLQQQRDNLFAQYEQARQSGDAAAVQNLARQYNHVQDQLEAAKEERLVQRVREQQVMEKRREQFADELLTIDRRFPILQRDGSGRPTASIDPKAPLVQLAVRYAQQDGVTLQKEHLYRAQSDLLLAAAQSANTSNARVRTTAQSYLDRTGLEAGGASAPPPPAKSPLEGLDREGLAGAVARQVRGKK